MSTTVEKKKPAAAVLKRPPKKKVAKPGSLEAVVKAAEFAKKNPIEFISE